MIDLAHVCFSCFTVTIFESSADYPRRCAKCDAIVRASAQPTFDDDLVHDEEADFVLELRPVSMDVAPF